MRLKVCGLTREQDAHLAGEAGADLVGAILVPSSPRHVDVATALRLGRAAERPLVLVVADLSEREVVDAAHRSEARVIQLHGSEPPSLLEALRREGSWELWKAVRVRSPDDILMAAATYGEAADALLLDGWHSEKLGGTGLTFPWEALMVARAGLPPELRLGVAGGLNSGNVGDAVTRLRPDIVDVSSGVETEPGVKDPDLVRAFLDAARAAEGRVQAVAEGSDETSRASAESMSRQESTQERKP